MNSRHSLNKLLKTVTNANNQKFFMSQLGDLGSGAGKGGGGGGTVRSAGGAFGKREAGKEEEYFYRQQKEQLDNLKDALGNEISFHEEQIKRHQEAIARFKNQIGSLEKK